VNRLPARFASKLEVVDDCWIWTGARFRTGYASVYMTTPERRGARLAHHVVYELLVGPIPEGHELDHTCHSEAVAAGTCAGGWDCPHRPCCNPEHLEPVTPQENMLRGASPAARHARVTHCPKDHPYEGENLYLRPNGSRVCRACLREQKRAYKARRREMDAPRGGR
jgi:hypothetical protein